MGQLQEIKMRHEIPLRDNPGLCAGGDGRGWRWSRERERVEWLALGNLETPGWEVLDKAHGTVLWASSPGG